MWELLLHDLEDAEDILVDEYIKRSWLNKTLMTCKEFETILHTIDTTKTTMLVIEGDSVNRVSRLPWSIWVAMLKDEATKLDKKKESRSNSQHFNHSTFITQTRGHSGRGGRHGGGCGSGRGSGSSNASGNRVSTKVTSGMQFTSKMTMIPEEYAKLTDAQRASLYDVRMEARDNSPSRSIYVASTTPAHTPAPAPAPAPVQQIVQAIRRAHCPCRDIYR
jgi:hypothetical protein